MEYPGISVRSGTMGKRTSFIPLSTLRYRDFVSLFFFFFSFCQQVDDSRTLEISNVSIRPLENRIDPWAESVLRGRIYKTNGEFLRENSSHGRSSRKAKSRCCNSASDKGPFPSFMGRKEGRGGLISDRSLKETRMELLKLPESS